MHWPDDGESMLLGATGSISRPAGPTLKKVFDTKGRFVHAFAAGPNGLLFAVGTAGLVPRSGDGGSAWSELRVPVKTGFYSAAWCNESLIADGTGVFGESTGGDTMTTVPTGAGLTAGAILTLEGDERKAVLCGGANLGRIRVHGSLIANGHLGVDLATPSKASAPKGGGGLLRKQTSLSQVPFCGPRCSIKNGCQTKKLWSLPGATAPSSLSGRRG